jgi:hypothetical protein
MSFEVNTRELLICNSRELSLRSFLRTILQWHNLSSHRALRQSVLDISVVLVVERMKGIGK